MAKMESETTMREPTETVPTNHVMFASGGSTTESEMKGKLCFMIFQVYNMVWEISEKTSNELLSYELQIFIL